MATRFNWKKLTLQVVGIALVSILLGVLANAVSPHGISYDCKKLPTPTPPPVPVVAATPAPGDGNAGGENGDGGGCVPVGTRPADLEESVLVATGFPFPDEGDGEFYVDVMTADEYWWTGEVLFIDSRVHEEYVQGHIAGAVNLSADHVEEEYPGPLADVPTHKPIIIYCDGGSCQLSLELQRFLAERCYNRIKVFMGGWLEWKDAGLPTVEGEAPGEAGVFPEGQ